MDGASASNLQQPLKVSTLHHFGITPFGAFCFECCLPVGDVGSIISNDLLKKHIKRKRHEITLAVPKIVTSLRDGMKAKFYNTTDFSSYIARENFNTPMCSCGISFSNSYNLQRHVKKYTINNHQPTSIIHSALSVESVFTTCKRVVQVSVLNQMKVQASSRARFQLTTTASIASSQSSSATVAPPVTTQTNNYLPSTTSTNTKETCHYLPLQSDNRKWVETTLDDVKNYFNAYKRPDESLQPYLPSLKLLTINGTGPVINRIRDNLVMMESIPMEGCETDRGLAFFLSTVEEWLKCYCREHVGLLDGKVRFRLQSFFDETILVNAGYNLNFNMREKEEVILKELKSMVLVSWRLLHNGEVNKDLSDCLSELVGVLHQIESKHDGIVTKTSVTEVISSLIVQRFFHHIMIESQSNAYTLLLGHRLVMLRLFYLKKEPTTISNSNRTIRELKVRSCSEFGSIVALHMHIYRLATASLIATTQAIGWDRILGDVSRSSLIHLLSPIINKTKQMNNNKLEFRSKTIKPNGDITVEDYCFRKCIWCKFIPKLIAKLDGVLDRVISGNDWRDIVNLSNAINVVRISSGDDVNKEDILHYNFSINVNGKITSESDLALMKEIHKDTIEELTALIMIVLHGTGVGAPRVSEIFRIELHQLEWRVGCLYFLTVSNKRRSANLSNKITSTHKAPPSLSRYLLLYDFIGREYSKGREQFLFSPNSNNLECNYDNQYFYREFSNIFELSTPCSGLIMRHFYTSICNYLFPDRKSNNFDKDNVSTVDFMAELSGHTATVHELFYSSSLNIELLYERYHHALGEPLVLDTDNSILPLGLATEEEVLHTLRVILGVNTHFFSEIQKVMLMDACNNVTKHTFCSLGCGGGKSMAWLVPVVRCSLARKRSPMIIVVMPYCFLLEHHVSSSSGLVGQCSNVRIASLKGKDVDENVVPNILRNKDSLPSILFVSLEALKKLIDYYFNLLKEFGSQGLLQKIFIDECHTILSELNFRNNYHALAKLVGLNIPIMLFSGSFQQRFVKDFLSYLLGSDEMSMFNIIIDKELFGPKLVRLEHRFSSDYIEIACRSVIDYVRRNAENNVHVIVATLDEGK